MASTKDIKTKKEKDVKPVEKKTASITAPDNVVPITGNTSKATVVTAGPAEKKKEAVVEKKPVDNSKPLVVTISRIALISNLKIALGFVEKKATMPVLTHILLDSSGNSCTLSATNLSVSWLKAFPCKGAKVSRCIPAEIFFKEVSAVSDSSVELAFREDKVTVDSRCDILTMKGEEYPAIKPPKGKDITITHLASALKKVLPSVGEKDTRYTLNGVYLNTKAHEIVATDGHRLHFDKLKIEGNGVDSIIIPKQAAQLIAKYAIDTPEMREVKKSTEKQDIKKVYNLNVFGRKVKAEVETDDYGLSVEFTGEIKNFDHIMKASLKGHDIADYLTASAEYEFLRINKPVTLKVEGTERASMQLCQGMMQFQLIQGTYPDYTKIIPKKNPIKVMFDSGDFLKIMDGAVPLSRQNTKAIRLTINGKMTIESMNPDIGQYKWQIDANSTGKSKGDYVVGFNAEYLITAIKVYVGEHGKVTMALDAPLSPCLINDNVVIMPMRT